MSKNRKNKGFTLVELSIVLIIIGILVAGIISGREIIRQAEYRSVISDYERFVTAFNTFVGLYSRVPGDINATEAAEIFAVDTVNKGGNDDGRVTLTVAADGYDEVDAVWEHLSKSNVLPGEFLGETPGGDDIPTIVNGLAPVNRVQGGLYLLFNNISGSPDSEFEKGYPNGLRTGSGFIFLIGSLVGNTFGSAENAVIDIVGASYIDTKLDDNNPSKGRVRAAGSNCVDEEDEDDIKYDFGNNGSCYLGIEF